MSQEPLTWEAALELYETALKAARAAGPTIETRHWHLKRAVRYFRERRARLTADAVTLEDLRAYQCDLHTGAGSRSGRALGARTVAVITTTLRGFFRFLEEDGLLAQSPARRLESPHVPPATPKEVLTVDEVKRLLRACETTTALGLRDRAAIEILYATGVRVGELVGLDLSDVNHQELEIAVRHGKGDKGRIQPITCSSYERLKDYVERARPALVSRHEDGARALFLGSSARGHGRRWTGEAATLALRRVAHAAKLRKHVTPHTLRRTFATHLLKGGVSLRHIQILLGHESLDTTAIYLRLDAEEIRRQVIQNHPREKFDA